MRLLRLVLLLALLPALALADGPQPGKLTVYFFDIGQGDSELIVSPTGKTMLIDAGPPDHEQHLVQRVKDLVHAPLDLVVLTHPHLDHLGGMAAVIEAVGAKRYMDSGFLHPSKSYSHLLEVVAKDVKTRISPEIDPAHPQDLIHVDLGGGAVFTIMWPRRPVEDYLTDTRSDPNSNSIVGKLTYGKTAFMLIGDAEPDTEDYLLQKKINFRATVLKVGHHGGRHSSTTPWLQAILPKAAVISCGVGNDYGHPGKETLERLGQVNAHVYRTDQEGEVVAVSDGDKVTMQAEREDAEPRVFEGDITGPVQLGPILPGERHASQATLDDRQRYGNEPPHESEPKKGGKRAHHKGSKKGHADENPFATPAELVGKSPEVPLPPPPAPDTLIPASVKEKYPEASSQPSEVRYVASRRSQVFHRANCLAVKKIKPANRVYFATRAEAAAHHRPAEDCNP